MGAPLWVSTAAQVSAGLTQAHFSLVGEDGDAPLFSPGGSHTVGPSLSQARTPAGRKVLGHSPPVSILDLALP